MMIYNTNAMLSLSRLPYHFWEMLNPKLDPLDNPGRSILSYIVAKSLTEESVMLPSELDDNLKRVIDFNDQHDKIFETLDSRIETLETILSNYNGDPKFWQISIDGMEVLRPIKQKLNELKISNAALTTNDFIINGELISKKLEINALKKMLNNVGIPFEWED